MSEVPNNWETLFDQADEDGRENSLFHSISSVNKRYGEDEIAGSGAMKNIIRTEDKVSGRVIAKAVLKNPDDEQAVESFLREARITALLQHPNIVPLYDMGISEDKQPFFTMKLIKGMTLKEILEGLQSEQSSFTKEYPLSKRIDIFLKVCEAMAYAHSEGVAHLDLKPDNIRVSEFGDVIICDWGLAAIIGDNDKIEAPLIESLDYYSKRYYTLCGEIKGTPGYMAPEQAKGGEEAKDEKTDIFALGSILYELLTLKKAIPGDDLKSLIANTIEGRISVPSQRSPEISIPSSLEAVCMKALKASPEERYQSVEEVIADIDSYRLGFVTEAEDFSFSKQLYLLYKRNKEICLVAFVLLSVMVIGSLFFIESLREEKQISTLALEESEKLHELNKRISKEASENYAAKGQVAYYRFQIENATDLVSAAISLNPDNELALSLYGKILCVQQQYSLAYEQLKKSGESKKGKKKNSKVDNDLANYCQSLQQKVDQKLLSIQEVFPQVQKNIDKDQRHIIKAQIYAWTIMNEKRQIDKELSDLERDIAWLLSQENNKKVKCKLYSVVGGFHLDLSGNGNLETIRSIAQLPIIKLDIRGCKIDEMALVIGNSNHQFLKEMDSFRATRTLLLDQDQEIDPHSFKKAKLQRH